MTSQETDTKPVERPILFSRAMVRAILDGKKTQTRRVMKRDFGLDLETVAQQARRSQVACECPYGQPGDRLWVRESGWMYGRWYEDGITSRARTRWRFDEFGRRVTFERPLENEMTYQGSVAPGYVFRPSIHMPRWASRITLELTDVRVQRLQEISEDDARAEGFALGEPMTEMDIELMRGTEVHELARAIGLGSRMSAKFSFLCTWDDLNEKRGYSWHVNPWVWALTFKRLEAPSHV